MPSRTRNALTLLAAAGVLVALTACTVASAPIGYRVEFGACESVPLAERATPTPEYMTPTPGPVETCTVIASGWLNVRATPNGKITGYVRAGATVNNIREQRDWMQINEDPAEWVAGWLVECDG
jgi:uncharacterized protein YgiM (DUF1202 family)